MFSFGASLRCGFFAPFPSKAHPVTCKAKKGDEDALRLILKHYEPMIVNASKQMVRTEKGTITGIVDEDLRAFIESELVLAIIHTYDPYRMPDGQHITE